MHNQQCWQSSVYQYSSDCTPFTTRQRFFSQIDGLTVRRNGKSGGEYLVQRGCVSDSTGQKCMLADRPIRLEDKTAITHWHVASCCCRNPLLCGHDSVLVLHHVYDRVILGALDRVHHQHLLLEFDQLHEDLSDEGYGYLRYLSTWRSVVGCYCHDVHGGLRWSVH